MLKRNAKWHHEIVHFPDLALDGWIKEKDKKDNFCSYTRWFLWKLLIVIPATVLIIGGVLGLYIAAWAALFFADNPSIGFFINQHPLWTVFHIFALLVLGACILSNYHDRVKSTKRKLERELEAKYRSGELQRPEPKPEGFLKTWYKSFKHKFCPKMEY